MRRRSARVVFSFWTILTASDRPVAVNQGRPRAVVLRTCENGHWPREPHRSKLRAWHLLGDPNPPDVAMVLPPWIFRPGRTGLRRWRSRWIGLEFGSSSWRMWGVLTPVSSYVNAEHQRSSSTEPTTRWSRGSKASRSSSTRKARVQIWSSRKMAIIG